MQIVIQAVSLISILTALAWVVELL